MQKKLAGIASLSGFICVALGAFGAHALKGRLSTEQLMVFETAVRYQFYHTLAMLLVAVMEDKIPGGKAKIPGYLFLTGIILFSGSLYLITLSYILTPETPWKSIGMVTPLGGICLMAGWIFIGVLMRQKNNLTP